VALPQGNRERVRVLYERLLDRTKHVKVWLSYARFEAEPLPLPEQDQQQQEQQQQPDQQQLLRQAGESLSAADRASRAARARAVYERGFRSIREGSPDAKEEAVMLLESWRDFEAAGSEFRSVAADLLVFQLCLVVYVGSDNAQCYVVFDSAVAPPNSCSVCLLVFRQSDCTGFIHKDPF
jgi:hypothetical protein